MYVYTDGWMDGWMCIYGLLSTLCQVGCYSVTLCEAIMNSFSEILRTCSKYMVWMDIGK